MSVLDEWTDQVREALGLEPAARDEHKIVLDLARDVAHGVLRPAAPVSAYLLGLAVGGGADPHRAAAAVTELARRWAAASSPATTGDGSRADRVVPVGDGGDHER
jgi:hypothetical protein